ncbi:hypothetical protein C8R45DRAFT_1106199 [Mycena sanguinolenta]|nr:hypothetical protein C8R45DRAFT_1106199 [Mycena sanguinolenta]
MDWIWSKCTTSPDPTSGMQTLHQMCSVIIEHVLTPSDIILSGSGFTLCPGLTEVLLDAILTCSSGLYMAMQHQIIWNWVHLIDKIYVAMVDLKSLQHSLPIHVLGRSRPSQMAQTLMSLPRTLRTKLPTEFLRAHDVSDIPSATNMRDVSSARGYTLSHFDVSISRSSTRDAHPSSHVGVGRLTNLVLEYRDKCDHQSLLSRTNELVKKTLLEEYKITDHGTKAHSSLSHFVLQQDLLIYVQDITDQMQSLLTHASALLPGKTTCFVVDPRQSLMEALRGSSTVQLIHISWDCLVKQMSLAQRAFDK